MKKIELIRELSIALGLSVKVHISAREDTLTVYDEPAEAEEGEAADPLLDPARVGPTSALIEFLQREAGTNPEAALLLDEVIRWDQAETHRRIVAAAEAGRPWSPDPLKAGNPGVGKTTKAGIKWTNVAADTALNSLFTGDVTNKERIRREFDDVVRTLESLPVLPEAIKAAAREARATYFLAPLISAIRADLGDNPTPNGVDMLMRVLVLQDHVNTAAVIEHERRHREAEKNVQHAKNLWRRADDGDPGAEDLLVAVRHTMRRLDGMQFNRCEPHHVLHTMRRMTEDEDRLGAWVRATYPKGTTARDELLGWQARDKAESEAEVRENLGMFGGLSVGGRMIQDLNAVCRWLVGEALFDGPQSVGDLHRFCDRAIRCLSTDAEVRWASEAIHARGAAPGFKTEEEKEDERND